MRTRFVSLAGAALLLISRRIRRGVGRERRAIGSGRAAVSGASATETGRSFDGGLQVSNVRVLRRLD